MDNSLILAVIGILLTIIFGVIGIILVRRKKYPGKITFIKQSSINLFNNIVKNFYDISILFENEPIKENLVYLKGSFINDGEIDIERNNIEMPVTIELPENCKWLRCKITRTSDDFKCDTIINNNNELQFDFKLFRRNEFFQFDAIVQTGKEKAKSKDFFDNLNFKHRISQTEKITTSTISNDNQMIKNKFFIIKRNLILPLGSFIMATIFVIISQLFFKTYFLHYLNYEKGNNIEYTAVPETENSINLKSISTKENKIISLTDFQSKTEYIPIIQIDSWSQKLKTLIYFGLAMLIIYLIFISIDFWKYRKNDRTYKIMRNAN